MLFPSPWNHCKCTKLGNYTFKYAAKIQVYSRTGLTPPRLLKLFKHFFKRPNFWNLSATFGKSYFIVPQFCWIWTLFTPKVPNILMHKKCIKTFVLLRTTLPTSPFKETKAAFLCCSSPSLQFISPSVHYCILYFTSNSRRIHNFRRFILWQLIHEPTISIKNLAEL